MTDYDTRRGRCRPLIRQIKLPLKDNPACRFNRYAASANSPASWLSLIPVFTGIYPMRLTIMPHAGTRSANSIDRGTWIANREP